MQNETQRYSQELRETKGYSGRLKESQTDLEKTKILKETKATQVDLKRQRK